MVSRRSAETREEYNVRMNAYMKARYADVAEKIKAYKLEHGCFDCGYNAHHAGLEFDHVNERKGNTNTVISRMMVRGWDRVLREIEENCQVVCATCHRIRTWERRQTF